MYKLETWIRDSPDDRCRHHLDHLASTLIYDQEITWLNSRRHQSILISSQEVEIKRNGQIDVKLKVVYSTQSPDIGQNQDSDFCRCGFPLKSLL